MTRAERRARDERAKQRVTRYVCGPPLTPRQVGMRARTPAACSCWMCGNPRHKVKGVERLTLQERRAQP